jgi:hypothetical protein
MITISKTRFLGIGVPPRVTSCPRCKLQIDVDSFVFYDGSRWMGHATFFCSEACLEADPKLEDKTHRRGDGVMMEWQGNGG